MTDQDKEKQNSQPPADAASGDSADQAGKAADTSAEKPAVKKAEPPPRPAPPENPLAAALIARFGDGVPVTYGIRDLEIHTTPATLLDVCNFLKNNSSHPYKFLRNLTAVDWPEQNTIEIIYHIAQFPDMTTICVKCRAPREGAQVESVTGIWPAANWLEREVYDLLGVEFKNHPDLRRIMLPPEWEGHPLRKDYKHADPDLPCLKPNCTPTN